MNAIRRFSLLATAGLLGIAVMLGWVGSRRSISADSAAQLVASLEYFDSTIVLARNAQPRGARGDALTLALGYLERERLGLGSPFRLAEEALRDPRMDSTMRTRTAWALLGRLRRGEAFVIDPAALDGAGPWSHDGKGAVGAAHVALIERTIARASDPRAGELAVRLAYALEAGKGALASGAPAIATEVAALVRDRHLARADLDDLLADAARSHEDALAMLIERRVARTFRVEQPAMIPLSAALRVEGMNAAATLAADLDTLGRAAGQAVAPARAPLIGAGFASRLAELGARRPSIAPISVVTRGRPQAKLRATNEETLAAAFAAAALAPDSSRRAAAIVVTSSAVALRAYNQAAPWFVGDAGPTAGDLVGEFGLAGVDFSRGVPAAWRPYYLRELANGLRDMQSVFPALSLSGLRIAFGTAELPDSALAMHDPRTRTLRLTINSSSGTLAHELSHDLDWQTSRRMFATAGGYSSDRAITEQRGVLASSMRGLAEARVLRTLRASDAQSLPDRPAELFARGVDWFTASSLALGGRTNGFLTGVQDAGIPGYAAGAPTAVGHAGVASLVSAIDQMTYVSDSAQYWFESLWSDASTIDPLVLVRRVFATPVGRIAIGTRSGTLPLIGARAAPCVGGQSAEARARARLMDLAVESRARGLALRRARYRFPGVRTDWANGLLGVAPWDPRAADGVLASLATGIVAELRSAPADQGVIPTIPASFHSDDGACR